MIMGFWALSGGVDGYSLFLWLRGEQSCGPSYWFSPTSHIRRRRDYRFWSPPSLYWVPRIEQLNREADYSLLVPCMRSWREQGWLYFLLLRMLLVFSSPPPPWSKNNCHTLVVWNTEEGNEEWAVKWNLLESFSLLLSVGAISSPHPRP